jgi:purine-binding chemotaxis protein CheW
MPTTYDTPLATAVTFRAGHQRYAVPIERVREIQKIVAFAEVPDENAMVIGMVDIRGEIVPVVDVRRLLGLPAEPYTLDTPMLVVSSTAGPVALIVDTVDTVAEMPADAAGAVPEMHSLASRVLGVHRIDDELVFLLDIDALLEPVELPEEGRAQGDE